MPETEEIEDKIIEVKSESHGFAWGCLVSLLIILFIIVILGALGWRYFRNQTLNQTTLEINSGLVTRNNFSAKDGEILVTGDKLKTGDNTDATVTFPNGSQLRLDTNTEITLNQATQSTISIYQALGRTWSRVVKLTGSESYEVETPSAVATVRGTAFSTLVDADTGIDTDEGAVDVVQKATKKKLLLEAGFGTKVSKLQKEAIREEIKNTTWFKKNRERDKKVFKRLRSSGLGLDDLAKIKSLIQKARGGQLVLTEEQKKKLEPLARKFQAAGGKVDASLAPDVAEALAIIDPENFSDIGHWTQVLQTAAPLIDKFQLLRFPSTE